MLLVAEEQDKILYDLVFPPNSYQLFKVDNTADVDGKLGFPGVFNLDYEETWEFDNL